MKKLILLAISQLLFCSILFAQTDDPGCSVVVNLTDTGCGEGTSCADATGCTSSGQFHVQCNGTGWIKAWVECSEGVHCDNCAVCVKIVTGGSGDPVTECGTLGGCDDDSCCTVCTYSFTPGDYIMRVCLLPCPGGNQQACCSGQCKAYATFSTNSLGCQ